MPALFESGAKERKATSSPLIHTDNRRVLALQQAEGVVGCSPAVQRHQNHEVGGPIPAAQAPLLRQHLWAQLQSVKPSPVPIPRPPDQDWIPPQLSPKPLDPLMLRLPQTELTQAPIPLPSLVPHPLAKKPNRLGPHGHIPTPRPAPPPLPLPTTLSQRSGPAPVPPQPSPPPCAAGGAAAPGAAGPPC